MCTYACVIIIIALITLEYISFGISRSFMAQYPWLTFQSRSSVYCTVNRIDRTRTRTRTQTITLQFAHTNTIHNEWMVDSLTYDTILNPTFCIPTFHPYWLLSVFTNTDPYAALSKFFSTLKHKMRCSSLRKRHTQVSIENTWAKFHRKTVFRIIYRPFEWNNKTLKNSFWVSFAVFFFQQLCRWSLSLLLSL